MDLPPPEITAIARNLWPSLQSVEIVDRYTVRLVNAMPDLTLEGRIARLGSEIVSKKAYMASKDWASWAQAPVSAGPYKVKEMKMDQYLVLTAHDDYFGGKPLVKEIRYIVVPEVSSRINGLLSGQYDFVTDTSYTLELLKMTQKMLDWKLLHADRTLTGYAASPAGLVSRL